MSDLEKIIEYCKDEINKCDKAIKRAYDYDEKAEIRSERVGYDRILFECNKLKNLTQNVSSEGK